MRHKLHLFMFTSLHRLIALMCTPTFSGGASGWRGNVRTHDSCLHTNRVGVLADETKPWSGQVMCQCRGVRDGMSKLCMHRKIIKWKESYSVVEHNSTYHNTHRRRKKKDILFALWILFTDTGTTGMLVLFYEFRYIYLLPSWESVETIVHRVNRAEKADKLKGINE